MEGACSWIGFGFPCRGGRGERTCSWTHAAAAAGLWEEEESPFLSPCIYSPISVLGCLRVVLPYPCPSFGLSWASFYFNSPLG